MLDLAILSHIWKSSFSSNCLGREKVRPLIFVHVRPLDVGHQRGGNAGEQCMCSGSSRGAVHASTEFTTSNATARLHSGRAGGATLREAAPNEIDPKTVSATAVTILKYVGKVGEDAAARFQLMRWLENPRVISLLPSCVLQPAVDAMQALGWRVPPALRFAYVALGVEFQLEQQDEEMGVAGEEAEEQSHAPAP